MHVVQLVHQQCLKPGQMSVHEPAYSGLYVVQHHSQRGQCLTPHAVEVDHPTLFHSHSAVKVNFDFEYCCCVACFVVQTVASHECLTPCLAPVFLTAAAEAPVTAQPADFVLAMQPAYCCPLCCALNGIWCLLPLSLIGCQAVAS